MTKSEEGLRAELHHQDAKIAVSAAVSLVKEYLIPQGRLEESESVLLTALGLQVVDSGLIVQLTLGEVYTKMNEVPRARRFLSWATESSRQEISEEANRLLQLAMKERE
jgi:hypothetical protein